MVENVYAKMDPTLVRNIKIAAVVVGAALAVVTVGVVLYKVGAIGHAETAEEIIEAAVQAA
jgi:phage shock protein PspC (stress-responsive transcriptional regulator)